MNKLVVCIMGQNCEKFIGMCLNSVKDADAFYYLDGGSTDNTLEISQDFISKNTTGKAQIDIHKYNQEDLAMNGKQRNFYLKYLKKNYPNDWALCLDADEVVDDGGIKKIKEFIQKANPGLYSVKMRHFIGTLGEEDATQPIHFCPNRLFKISEADKYTEVEHSILQGDMIGNIDVTTIWHLAYIPNLFSYKQKYENHLKKSNMHTPQYLNNWYRSHIFGQYPKKPINLIDIPTTILNEFGIDKDELYFANRRLEVKHFLMTKQWNDYFKPTSVCDLGCGLGPYLVGWKNFLADTCLRGYEISNFAVSHAFVPEVMQGDISEYIGCNWDLITCIDVLEHLDDIKLGQTMKLLSDKENAKKILFSIPFIGDPNLEADSTHIQKKTKDEWIKLIESYGIKIKETPKDWLYSHQILIGELE